MKKLLNVRNLLKFAIAVFCLGLVMPFYGIFFSKVLSDFGFNGHRLEIIDNPTTMGIEETIHFDPIINGTANLSFILLVLSFVILYLTITLFLFNGLFFRKKVALHELEGDTHKRSSVGRWIGMAFYVTFILTLFPIALVFAYFWLGYTIAVPLDFLSESLQSLMTWTQSEMIVALSCHDSFYNACGADYNPSLLEQLFMWLV